MAWRLCSIFQLKSSWCRTPRSWSVRRRRCRRRRWGTRSRHRSTSRPSSSWRLAAPGGWWTRCRPNNQAHKLVKCSHEMAIPLTGYTFSQIYSLLYGGKTMTSNQVLGEWWLGVFSHHNQFPSTKSQSDYFFNLTVGCGEVLSQICPLTCVVSRIGLS